MNLSANVKITSALDHDEGSADRNGATLDMQGFEGVLIVFKFGDIASGATTSVKAQQGAASNLSDAADLEGTGITVAADDDNQIFVIDLYKPQERYIRGVVDKDASNNTEEMAWYIQYGPTEKPCDNNVADAITTELHASPDEGTA
jgi:hypothetical protein